MAETTEADLAPRGSSPAVPEPAPSELSEHEEPADLVDPTESKTSWEYETSVDGSNSPPAFVVEAQRAIVAKFFEVGCCSKRCTAHVSEAALLRRRLLSIQMDDSHRDFFVLGQLMTSHMTELAPPSTLRSPVSRPRRERNVFRFSAEQSICRAMFLMMNAIGVKRYRTLLGRFKSRECMKIDKVVTKRKATSLTRRNRAKRGRVDMSGVPRPLRPSLAALADAAEQMPSSPDHSMGSSSPSTAQYPPVHMGHPADPRRPATNEAARSFEQQPPQQPNAAPGMALPYYPPYMHPMAFGHGMMFQNQMNMQMNPMAQRLRQMAPMGHLGHLQPPSMQSNQHTPSSMGMAVNVTAYGSRANPGAKPPEF